MMRITSTEEAVAKCFVSCSYQSLRERDGLRRTRGDARGAEQRTGNWSYADDRDKEGKSSKETTDERGKKTISKTRPPILSRNCPIRESQRCLRLATVGSGRREEKKRLVRNLTG